MEEADPLRQRVVAEALLALRLRRMVRVSDDKDIDTGYISHVEYQLFLDEKQSAGEFSQPDHWQRYRFDAGQGRQPVVGVRPTDAVAYCDWLTARESGVWRYRLPFAGELADVSVVNRLGAK